MLRSFRRVIQAGNERFIVKIKILSVGCKIEDENRSVFCGMFDP